MPWIPHLYPNFSSVQFSRSVVSDSLRPHESQHSRPPCPSSTPGVSQLTHSHNHIFHVVTIQVYFSREIWSPSIFQKFNSCNPFIPSPQYSSSKWTKKITVVMSAAYWTHIVQTKNIFLLLASSTVHFIEQEKIHSFPHQDVEVFLCLSIFHNWSLN